MLRGEEQRRVFVRFAGKMGMERSWIAGEGTIKKGLHKTPTTVFEPQLFDARFLLRDTALLILYEIASNSVQWLTGDRSAVPY